MMKNRGIVRSSLLLALGVIYLVLVAATFMYEIDLASNKTMQYLLHIDVLLTAFAYPFFAEYIYSNEAQDTGGKLALIFASLFTVPIVVGRGVGFVALSNPDLFLPPSLYNFYADVSISRTLELLSWTTFYPLSMLFLSKVFFRKKEARLGWLCLSSAICCFIAFLSFVSANPVFQFIGLFGWGPLFLLIVLVYLLRQIKKYKNETA